MGFPGNVLYFDLSNGYLMYTYIKENEAVLKVSIVAVNVQSLRS